MEVMKRKLYILGSILLFVLVVIGIVILSRGPVQAVDPSKDYSKAAKPSTQVLGDTVNQPGETTASQSDLAATPQQSNTTTVASASAGSSSASVAKSSPTTTVVSPVAQNVTSGAANTGGDSENNTAQKEKGKSKLGQGAMDALLQTISHIGL
jgi:cytoskeletal protein RodZ